VENSAGDVVQMNHATTVHVTGDRATARSTMESTYWFPDGKRMQLFAAYDDTLVREKDGEWRFERRAWRTKVMFDATGG
jgi:ketosteroid isomerase-like protein